MTTTITGAGGVSQVQAGAIEHGDLPSGSVIQVVNFQTGAMATGTTVIPFDTTIPQITEGDEYMTLAITPTSATNILLIESVAQVANDTSSVKIGVALFVGTTANALASTLFRGSQVGNNSAAVAFTHKMTAGVETALTFRIRIGAGAASTTTFNGIAGASYGGTIASSITITEYAA